MLTLYLTRDVSSPEGRRSIAGSPAGRRSIAAAAAAGGTVSAKLNLVDLAGMECAGGAPGGRGHEIAGLGLSAHPERRLESRFIITSLEALTQVVSPAAPSSYGKRCRRRGKPTVSLYGRSCRRWRGTPRAEGTSRTETRC